MKIDYFSDQENVGRESYISTLSMLYLYSYMHKNAMGMYVMIEGEIISVI